MLNIGQGVEKILSPKSIALVGVSGDTGKASFTGATGILANLNKSEYKGKIYPINPKYPEIFGLKAYENLSSLPEVPDLLVVGIASQNVLPLLKEAAALGVGGCIIISSGFAEDENEENKQLQEQMVELCQKSGMRVCGPNCLGISNVHDNITAITSVGLNAGPLNPGGIALVSQSGALVSSMISKAKDKGIGFSYIVSSGNDADLDLADYIYYLVEDRNTKVIAAYIEGIKSPSKFKKAAALCKERGIPLLVFKVGRSAKGAKAVQAHTGSIAGEDVTVSSMFEKYDVTRMDSLDELLEIAQAFSVPQRDCLGTRLGVITVSGGTGSILSDLSEEYDVQIPELSSETVRQLREILPSYTSIANPVDTTAGIIREPENLIKTARVMAKDDGIDVIYISLTGAPPDFEVQVVDVILRLNSECPKPLVVGWYSGGMNQEGMKRLQINNVPCFNELGTSLQYIKMLAQRAASKKHPLKVLFDTPPNASGLDFLKGKKGVLNEFESKNLLRKYGIPVVEEINAQSIEEARNFAERIGYPVVMKINSDDIPHKTEAGCVILGVKDAADLEKAYSTIINNAKAYKENAKIQGVLVQEMVRNAKECIIGVKSDPHFGAVLMFGLGGIFVELLKDVTFRMAPVSEEEAVEMVKNIKGFQMLDGYRQQPKFDVAAIVDTVQKVGRLAYDLRDQLSELDINPLMVLESGKGAKIADALIVLN